MAVGAYGQQAPGDARVRRQADALLAAALPDTVKLDSLFALAGGLNMYASDLPEALYRRGLALAQAANAPLRTSFFLSRLGLLHNNKRGDVDSADWYWRGALGYAQQADDDRWEAQLHGYLRYTSAGLERYERALQHCFDALTIYRALNDSVGIGATYNDMAGVLIASEDYHEALDYARRAEALLANRSEHFELSATLEKVAECYRELGDSARTFDALSGSRRAILAMDSTERLINYTYHLLTYAKGQSHFGAHQAALATYREALALAERYFPAMRTDVLLNTADLYYQLERYREALAIYTQVEASELRDRYGRYQRLAVCYAQAGQFEAAYRYQQRYQQLVDSAGGVESARAMQRLKTEFETEQKESQIAQQRAQLVQQEKVQRLLWTVGVLLAVIVLGLLYGGWKNRRKNQRLAEFNRDLNAKNTLLDERNAQNELLLREIHHRVKNNLEVVSSLLSLQAAQVDSPEVLAAMEESQSRVQSMGIIHRKLYQGSTLAAIEMKDYFLNLSENILDTFGLEERVAIELAMEELELDIDAAVPIGLIVNELITNALKYAFPDGRPGGIRICLERHAEGLRLEVADNGVGMADGPAAGTGFGGQLVELLTRQLNGQVETRVAGGTQVQFRFHLDPAA